MSRGGTHLHLTSSALTLSLMIGLPGRLSRMIVKGRVEESEGTTSTDLFISHSLYTTWAPAPRMRQGVKWTLLKYLCSKSSVQVREGHERNGLHRVDIVWFPCRSWSDRRKEGVWLVKQISTPESSGKHLKRFPGSTPTSESVPRWYPSVCIFRKL